MNQLQLTPRSVALVLVLAGLIGLGLALAPLPAWVVLPAAVVLPVPICLVAVRLLQRARR